MKRSKKCEGPLLDCQGLFCYSIYFLQCPSNVIHQITCIFQANAQAYEAIFNTGSEAFLDGYAFVCHGSGVAQQAFYTPEAFSQFE